MVAAMQKSYDADVTDEFVKPIVRVDAEGKAVGTIRPGDMVIFFNYRNDRAKELTVVLTQEAVKLDNTLRFLDELEKRGIPVWIRHVIVPGLTDDDEALSKLAEYISSYNVVQKAELLPYHTMGAYKYEAQGLDYKLKGVEPLSAERLANAKAIFMKHGITV